MPSATDLQREVEWRRCKGSSPSDWEACLYFLQSHVKIRHPERGRISFELRDAQRETLKAWLTERYVITLKARQIGYSTLAASMTLWETMFWPDKAIIMLSRGEREAISLLRKTKYAYRYLPEWMRNRGPRTLQDTQTKVVFDNESQIESLPSTQDPARGESAYRIIVDEWAFLENPAEAWASIEPVADVGGRVTGLSTANGSGNFFHVFWQAACNGNGRFRPLFYPWSANSDRDDTWYEDKKEDLVATPWILHQEYPRNPEEAFIKSGRSVFDVDQLEALDTYTPKVGRLWAQTPESHYAEFREHSDGEFSMFAPPDPKGVYAIGADVAEGLEHGDYSSAHVLDHQGVVATWHGHVDPDEYASVLARIGYFYNAALIGVEVNNHGLTTCVGLQRLRYPRIYYRTDVDAVSRTQSRKVGWRTLQNTKPYVIDQLAQSIRGERTLDEDGNRTYVGGFAVREAATISELKLFVREPDGKKMHGSPYDDRVMSLAIGVEMLNFVHQPEYSRAAADPWGTLDWWESQLETEKTSNWVIGGNSVRKGTLASSY